MTAAARIRAIRAKAAQKLDAARKNLAAGLPDDAVSRAYYAMYHGALAALATVHERPRTHKGVLVRFQTHFVEPGRFPRDLFHAFGAAKNAREYGDYETGTYASEAEARAILEDAERFLEEVDRLLADAGA